MVCNQCGLLCPRYADHLMARWSRSEEEPGLLERARAEDWPSWFPECPGCGAPRREVGWPHHMDDLTSPWKQLDGWIGWRARP
jgi:hypothetical protein